MEQFIIVNLSLDHRGAAVRGNGKSRGLNGEPGFDHGSRGHNSFYKMYSQKISPKAAWNYHQMKKKHATKASSWCKEINNLFNQESSKQQKKAVGVYKYITL